MDTRAIFNNIETLEGWARHKGATADGEDSHLENKAVEIDLQHAQPSEVGDFKLRIAKEMSAFANTDSGILAIGISDSLKVSNKTPNLIDWLDKNIRDLLEPQLAAIDFKVCKADNDDEFVLVYIPKGKVIPYRVGSVKSCTREKRNLREYFQRIGTNSVPIPMPIVRSLYLSNERSLDIETYVEPTQVYQDNGGDEEPYIELGLIVKPDQIRLVNEYYLESFVTILDEDLKPLRRTPTDIIPFGSNSANRPAFHPGDKSYPIYTFKFQKEAPPASSSEIWAIAPILPEFGVERIPAAKYPRIGGFYVETKFACDGFPLREDRRLLIFNGTVTNSEIKTRAHEMRGWSSDCLVVSWFAVTDESGLYHKIVGFMNDMGFSTEPVNTQ